MKHSYFCSACLTLFSVLSFPARVGEMERFLLLLYGRGGVSCPTRPPQIRPAFKSFAHSSSSLRWFHRCSQVSGRFGPRSVASFLDIDVSWDGGELFKGSLANDFRTTIRNDDPNSRASQPELDDTNRRGLQDTKGKLAHDTEACISLLATLRRLTYLDVASWL